MLSLLLQVVRPWFPSHLAALRTMKAEVAVGLREGQAAALQAEEPDWSTSGQYGSIQFVPFDDGDD